MSNIANINQERFKQHVVPILETLSELNIIFWLDFGTLLGAVRDKGISDWDHDFDISILDSDREKLIQAKDLLQAKGFKVVLQKNLHWFEDLMQIYIPRYEVSTDNKGRIQEGFDHVDIYIYTLVGDMCCMRRLHEPASGNYFGVMSYRLFRMINKLDLKYSDKKVSLINKPIMCLINILPDKVKVVFSNLLWRLYVERANSAWLVAPCEFFSKFSCVTLYGYKLNIPQQYKKYLEYRYSDKWGIPDPNWDVSNNGGCVIKKLKNDKITHILVETVNNLDKYLWK